MAVNWLRRSVLTAACASVALLAACGSSTIESALTPARFVAFGDGFSDVGQVKNARYTVNDGSVNNWTEQLAATYGITLTAKSAGGTSYAQGNARVSAKPDAAGNASTPTVTQQVDSFLAAGGTKANDVVLLNAGVADIIAEMAAVKAGSQTTAQMSANIKQAGRELGAQANRLVNAGAKYVVVAGAYNLGKSPWASNINEVALLTDASASFNAALKLGFDSPTNPHIFYIDTEDYFNLLINNPGSYAFDNATTPVCTSVDTNNGIGIGIGQVNSALCEPIPNSLLPSVTDYSKYVFADSVYFTPAAQRLFGTYAYERLRARW